MVSNDTKIKAQNNGRHENLINTRTRIESEIEVKSYLQDLRYALQQNAQITFQAERLVDQNRDLRYTNPFTVADLFPDENPVTALKRELQTLTVHEYMRTVKDLRFSKRSEMREFGNSTVFVMSFHYAEIPFTPDMFPYRSKAKGVNV